MHKSVSITEIFEYVPNAINLTGFPNTEVLNSLQRFFGNEIIVENHEKYNPNQRFVTPSFPQKYIEERQDFFNRIGCGKRIQKGFFDKNLPRMDNIGDYDSINKFLDLCDEIYKILDTAKKELRPFKHLPETKSMLSKLSRFDSKLEIMLKKLKEIEDIRTFAIDTQNGIITSISELPKGDKINFRGNAEYNEWEHELFNNIRQKMKKEAIKISNKIGLDFKNSIINYAREQFRFTEKDNLRKDFEKLAFPIRMHSVYNKFLEVCQGYSPPEDGGREIWEEDIDFCEMPNIILPKFGRTYDIQGLFPLKLMSKYQNEPFVPINFKSKPYEKKFLVAGLHSGGKSFLLENIILLSFIGQAGLHIPADSLSLPKYEKMFYYRNVENQSREGKLETELKSINNIICKAGPRDLVVIDEFLDSTTADVGAALGLEILNRLIKLKSTVFVTSHRSTNYAELAKQGWTLLSPEYKVENGLIKPTWTLTRAPPNENINRKYALQKYKDNFDS